LQNTLVQRKKRWDKFGAGQWPIAGTGVEHSGVIIRQHLQGPHSSTSSDFINIFALSSLIILAATVYLTFW
jgi:hypothetical protein